MLYASWRRPQWSTLMSPSILSSEWKRESFSLMAASSSVESKMYTASYARGMSANLPSVVDPSPAACRRGGRVSFRAAWCGRYELESYSAKSPGATDNGLRITDFAASGLTTTEDRRLSED